MQFDNFSLIIADYIDYKTIKKESYKFFVTLLNSHLNFDTFIVFISPD